MSAMTQSQFELFKKELDYTFENSEFYRKKFAEAGIEADILAPLGTVSHGYTNHRLTAHFFRLASVDSLSMKEISEKLGDRPHRFVRWDRTGELAMPAHHRKMAERYLSGKKRIQAEQLTL